MNNRLAPTDANSPSTMGLGELSDRAHALIAENAYSANTLRAMSTSWSLWSAFCAARGCSPMPADPLAIVEFIAAREQRCKPATISRDIAMISLRHTINGIANACTDARITMALRAVRNKPERIDRTTGKRVPNVKRSVEAINQEHVAKALAKLRIEAARHPRGSYERIRPLRDGALLMTAYACMLRRSELVALRLQDLKPSKGNSGALDVFVASSKTDQERVGFTLLLPIEGARWVSAWIEESGVEKDGMDAPVFRALPARDRHRRLMPPLHDAEVARIFKRAIGNKRVSGHSPRIGATEDRVLSNHELPKIMSAGRWKSSAMVAHYARNVTQPDGPITQMFSTFFKDSDP